MNAIGIDIGATKVKGVVATSSGRILIRREVLTKANREKNEILRDIISIADFLKKESQKKHFNIKGVGIGVPGMIKSGKLIFGGGTLTQLVGLDLAKGIKKEIGFKVFADNDSNCFALAESYFGAGKHYKRVAGVIWGTGIGGGFIDKNNRGRNRHRMSVEIGHFVVEPNIKSEPKDACGARGCVENLASGKNIVRRYYAMGGKIKNAGVKEIYRSKEKIAKKVLEDAYKYLGMGISILIKRTKPEIVVIGGGVSSLPQSAYKKLVYYIYRYADKFSSKIVKSKLGNFGGALGAASLMFRRK